MMKEEKQLKPRVIVATINEMNEFSPFLDNLKGLLVKYYNSAYPMEQLRW